MKRHQEDIVILLTISLSLIHFTHTYTLVLFFSRVSLWDFTGPVIPFFIACLFGSSKPSSSLLSRCHLAVVLCLLHQAVIRQLVLEGQAERCERLLIVWISAVKPLLTLFSLAICA